MFGVSHPRGGRRCSATWCRRRQSSVLFAQHVHGRGREFFEAACARDLEGVVAKHRDGIYGEHEPTRWWEIKNAGYFLLRYLDQAKRARGGAAACAALVNAIEAQQA